MGNWKYVFPQKSNIPRKMDLAEKEGEFADIFGTANLTEQGSGKSVSNPINNG